MYICKEDVQSNQASIKSGSPLQYHCDFPYQLANDLELSRTTLVMHPLTNFQSLFHEYVPGLTAKISKWLKFQLEIIVINREFPFEKGRFCFRSLSSSEEGKFIWMAVLGKET